MRTETQISAGGVVLKRTPRALEAVLISVGTPARWQLPKGLIDTGETAEAAALREVREEAGVSARIQGLIEKAEYWYQVTKGGERVRFHKYVHFFLMWYESGDVVDHDREVNEARWFPAAEAVSKLAFRSERAIVEKAAAIAGEGTP